MSRKQSIELFDDFDGSVASETVIFGLDKKLYSIDLNETHAAELRALLEPYIKAGRRWRNVGKASIGSRYDASEIRAWAAENGIEVSARGRIPEDIVEQYRNAR